ncbi:TrkH family potassium uptake protein [Williamwhitmania taraxaci]|uniref:Trk system potassium uptake protein TrkH n=1 Tax=Williamwhitmania taraxaci TaxID=1640674 RepID=A0A1G6H5I6_9BACT|nr:TrkH family potassium uptake protein [Williamwhitmania taraxaci]SDB89384.1 trk system potassium uptake protein TrkH [Williamwhitmania taraxaci]
MRWFKVIRTVGLVLLFNAAFMAISAVISLFNQDTGFIPLLLSMFITIVLAVFPVVFVPYDSNVNTKEGYAIVVLSWLVSCVVAMLPYLLWGGEFSLVNAWYEVVSGYTTTGSTILNNVEALPPSLLFWRASTHFIGGIGIVLFALVVMPAFGKLKTALSKIELSPLAKDNFKYQARKTMHIIVVVYLGLTLSQTILLKIAGMSWFDAVCHAFATIATGGFSTKNLSIAFYHSPSIEIITMVFMFLSGLHFGLIWATIMFHKFNLFTSAVTRYYFFSLIVGIALVTINIKGPIYHTWVDALRYASFQVISVGTTTGFANADSAIWPPFSILIMLFLILQCACSGSTSGGIKTDRVVIFYQTLKRQVKKLQHPNAIIPVKVKKFIVDEELVSGTILFIALYIFIVFISTVLLAAMGVDILSSFSASAACMGNVGPGFGIVGSMTTYSSIPDLGKWILSIVMLLGRMEIYGLLLLFLMKSWK